MTDPAQMQSVTASLNCECIQLIESKRAINSRERLSIHFCANLTLGIEYMLQRNVGKKCLAQTGTGTKSTCNFAAQRFKPNLLNFSE